MRFIEITGLNGATIAINTNKIIELADTGDGHCEFILEGNWREISTDSYEAIKKRFEDALAAGILE